jgi:PKD repeat protein
MKRFLLPVLAVLWAYSVQAQVTLPFTEGFENIGSTTTFTADASSINGLSGWAYEQTSRGRVRFKAGNSFYNNGSAAATLDVSANFNNSTNYLILTLDLSNYKKKQLELSFYFMHHGEESNNDDRVWVRGASSDNWVEIYNWYQNRGSAANWNFVDALDIDATLARANQEVSSTFQVRFGQRDNFQARNTSGDDGVTFDDITIKEVFNNHASVSSYGSVCSGNNNLTATITNNGKDTIKSGVVSWWVNSNKQSTAKFNTTIPPAESAVIDLGNYNFGSGSHEIIAIVDSVNNVVDENINDTLKQTVLPGLVGTYSVGGSSADFNSFSDVVNALNTRGICGVVTFNINAGTYSGANLIGNISGANSTNTVTFNGGDSSRTIIANNSGAVVYTLALENSQYITFKNLQFQSSRWAVYMSNNCSDINFENCFFNLSQTGTSQDILGIVASSSSASETGSGENVTNLVIDNCNFNGGERSIQLMGSTTTNTTIFRITNNRFERAYYSALGLYDLRNVHIINNLIGDFRNNGANAVVAYDLDNVRFENNEIEGDNYAVYFEDFNLNTNSAATFINNLIYSSGNGVYLNNARIVNFYHNTIVGRPALRFNAQSGIDLRNNILYGVNNYALFSPGSGGFTALDWNHYYSNSTNKFAYDNNNYTSLGNWTSDFPELNNNSIESLPEIINASTNPRLKTNTAAVRGLSLGIMDDVDGDSRCEFPSIGADESEYTDPKPKVSFSLPDTSYVNTIVNVSNGADAQDLLVHDWFVNGVKVDSLNHNLEYTFTSTGRYKITLKTSNCSSFDTISKFVIVKTVERAPVARFKASSVLVKVGEIISFENNTLNGASQVYWSISPDIINKKDRTFFYQSGSDSLTYQPSIYFVEPGNYAVCLSAKNSKGNDENCKFDYITVVDEATMCNESNSLVTDGVLRDPGGTGDYAGRQQYNCTYTIEPCAKNLKLKFTEFDLINNRDYLRIYDGKDNSGNALHDYNTAYSNGLTGDDGASYFRDQLVAKSGSAYLEFTTNWFFGAPGFEIEWTSTPLKVAPPTADFEMPDTICVGTELNIENKSSGRGNRYTWQFLSKVTNTVEYTDSAVNHFFFFQGDYRVRLIVNNCGGSDTIEKDIKVVEASAAPTAKIHVDIPNPDKGQTVTLTDVSTLNGYLCSEFRNWTITPNTFSYVTGFSSQGQITKVTFRDTGCYDIRLIASNSNGLDTVVVKCAVRVIDRCVPTVGNLNADLGIARVSLEGINNSSTTGDAAYTDYRSGQKAELQAGAQYEIKIWRAENPNLPMNRAAWIDYNHDGDFDDNGEEIARSSSANTDLFESFKFRVPRNAKLGNATLRIGVARGTGSNTPCGQNGVGEFEDYLVNIVEDYENPEITLYGSDTIQIEQCASIIDPMGFAIDNGIKDTLTLKLLDTLNTSVVGKQVIRYSAVDSNNNQSFAQRVFIIITDTTAPTLFLKGSDTLYHEVNTTYLDPGYEAKDNCTGLIDTGYCSVNENILGTYTCNYEAEDARGFKKTISRTVIVRDTKAPFVDSLIGGDTVEHQLNTTYLDKGVAFKDNYYSNADVDVVIKGQVDTTKKGTYTLWYILTDKSGNTDSTYRIVIVDDYQTPKVSLIGNKYITINVFSTYKDDSVTYTDYNGGTNGLTLTITGTYIDHFGYNQTADSIGQFTLIYTVSTVSGSKTEEIRYINVVDRVAPILTLKGDNPLILKKDETFVEPGWTVTDNYWKDPLVWVYNWGKVNTEKPDTYYLYYFAADSSANISDTLIRMVIVEQPDGINGASGSSLKVYPNPTRDFAIIEIGEGLKPEIIRLIDVTGKELKTFEWLQNGNIKVDLSNQPEGLYQMIIFDGNQVTSVNLIKQ